ncbi:MAG: L-serine ammonia-lyase, iron-sulfur-dependent, subunit beta [Clostridia bacterium]|nr:L-serine ammonia-lyase, iron-sulfur-dependent, subunit beta [Clostridia bacterium]
MRNFSCFDILGPVMVGPSSSHTAGAVRLGRLARAIAGGLPKEVKILLHGSFSQTYRGHGTDLALIGGLLGFETDDVRIRDSFEIAKQQGLIFQLVPTNLGEGFHPNSVKFLITTVDGEKLSITGASVGGGNVVITHINDDEIELKGDLPALITTHRDIPGVISQVCGILAGHNINIAFMRVFRKEKRKLAHMVVETDEKVEPDVLEEILKIETVENVRAIEPV